MPTRTNCVNSGRHLLAVNLNGFVVSVRHVARLYPLKPQGIGSWRRQVNRIHPTTSALAWRSWRNPERPINAATARKCSLSSSPRSLDSHKCLKFSQVRARHTGRAPSRRFLSQRHRVGMAPIVPPGYARSFSVLPPSFLRSSSVCRWEVGRRKDGGRTEVLRR
jgi:hypothetical protein